MKGLKRVKMYRRGMAFMLAVVMVAVNILAGADTAYAEEGPGAGPFEVVCRLDAEIVKAAIEEVMQGQDPAAADPEEETNSGEGQLYELGASAGITPSVSGVEVKLLYDAAVNEVVVRVTNTSEETLTFKVQVGDDGYATAPVEVTGVPMVIGEDNGGNSHTGETDPGVASPCNTKKEELVDVNTASPANGNTAKDQDEPDGGAQPGNETGTTGGTGTNGGTETVSAGPDNNILNLDGETGTNTVDVRIPGSEFGCTGLSAVTLTVDGTSTGFDTIQEAIEAIVPDGSGTGTVITINQDLTDVIVDAKNKGSVTLDLNGHTLAVKPGETDPLNFEIGGEDVVCIQNGSIEGGQVTNHAICVSGVIEKTGDKSGTVKVYQGGSVMLKKLTISGFVVTGGGSPDVVHLNNIMDVTVSECTITNNQGMVINSSSTGEYTNGSYPTLGKIEISGCTVSNNECGSSMVYINMEDIDITNCTFSENKAREIGALAIAGKNGTDALIKDCRFLSNSAGSVGALKIGQEGSNYSAAEVAVDGCTFTGNEATNEVKAGKDAKDAGAIANYAVMTIGNGTQITGNTSGANGAIYNFGKLTVEDTVITGNKAMCGDDHSTGGIKSRYDYLWIQSGEIVGNYKGNDSADLSDIMAMGWIEKLLPASEMSGPEIGSDIYLWTSVSKAWTIKETFENGVTSKDKGSSSGLNLAAKKTEI